MLKCTLVLILFETSKNMLLHCTHARCRSLRMVSTTMIAAASPKRNFEWFEERCGSGRRRYRQRFTPSLAVDGGFVMKERKLFGMKRVIQRGQQKIVVSPTAHVVLIFLPPCYTWPRITGWLADNDLHPGSRPDQFSLSLYILVHEDHGQCLLSTWRCPSTWSWQHMRSSSNWNCLQYIYYSLHSMQIADLEPHKILSVTTWSGFHAQLGKKSNKATFDSWRQSWWG